jgi:hypothetical protein
MNMEIRVAAERHDGSQASRRLIGARTSFCGSKQLPGFRRWRRCRRLRPLMMLWTAPPLAPSDWTLMLRAHVAKPVHWKNVRGEPADQLSLFQRGTLTRSPKGDGRLTNVCCAPVGDRPLSRLGLRGNVMNGLYRWRPCEVSLVDQLSAPAVGGQNLAL